MRADRDEADIIGFREGTVTVLRAPGEPVEALIRRALSEQGASTVGAIYPERRQSAAVSGYVEIVCKRRAAGRPIAQFDAQIAAIALLHGDKLATRNSSDFEGCGLSLIDPWGYAA